MRPPDWTALDLWRPDSERLVGLFMIGSAFAIEAVFLVWCFYPGLLN